MEKRNRPNRREWLALVAGATLVGCDSSAPHRGLFGAMERFTDRAQRMLFDPNKSAPELPESANTSDEDFPAYFVSPSVPIAPAGWQLKVGGMVAREMAFSVEELQRMPRTDTRVRHHCVEGWSAVASWHGVRVSEIARIVGADPQAQFVEFRSFDSGYSSSWDRASACHPQSILAWGKNGKDLTPAAGAPLRLYASVKLGYKMVKYLTEVRFLDRRTGGYWEDKGYEWFAGV